MRGDAIGRFRLRIAPREFPHGRISVALAIFSPKKEASRKAFRQPRLCVACASRLAAGNPYRVKRDIPPLRNDRVLKFHRPCTRYNCVLVVKVDGSSSIVAF